MITLTTEQAQQIEEALEDIVRVFEFETGTPVEALAAIREALAEQELYEPEGRCKECLAYNGHLDYCSKASPVSVEAAVLAEREACANVCEEVNTANKGFPLNAKTYAAAIRARGEK